MKLNEIIKAVNDVSGVDITKKTRIQYVVICRYMYYKIAKELSFSSNNSIAKAVNQRHCSMNFALSKIEGDLKIKKYKNVYNKILLKLGVVEPEKVVDNNINVLTLPSWINEKDILEFKETRLDPYVRMLKTRSNYKQLINK